MPRRGRPSGAAMLFYLKDDYTRGKVPEAGKSEAEI
jgi:hypothetical protein